jgi:K+-sensing histidine kinase KdpD
MVEKGGKFTEYSVIDTGKSLNEEELHCLFDPPIQSSRSQMGGMGLGLVCLAERVYLYMYISIYVYICM